MLVGNTFGCFVEGICGDMLRYVDVSSGGFWRVLGGTACSLPLFSGVRSTIRNIC